jgi:hypothetical protein
MTRKEYKVVNALSNKISEELNVAAIAGWEFKALYHADMFIKLIFERTIVAPVIEEAKSGKAKKP